MWYNIYIVNEDKEEHIIDILEILDLPVIGNAFNDANIFTVIDDFIMDSTNKMSDKILCIKKLDETMGDIADSYGELDVIEYIAGR